MRKTLKTSVNRNQGNTEPVKPDLRSATNADTLRLVRENITREWPCDAEGFPHRKAARVILINQKNEVYLIKGHDYGDASHCWWFTVGGGLKEKENFIQGAERELLEETGLQVDFRRFEGPVLFRKATFYFALETRKQDEYFFLLRIDNAEQKIIDAGLERKLTDLELQVLETARWFELEELKKISDSGELIYPLGLAKMLDAWIDGWDGVMLEAEENR